jgi:hypothetical protein
MTKQLNLFEFYSAGGKAMEVHEFKTKINEVITEAKKTLSLETISATIGEIADEVAEEFEEEQGDAA